MTGFQIFKLVLEVISGILALAIFVLIVRYTQLLRQVVEAYLGPIRPKAPWPEINKKTVSERWQKLTESLDQQGLDMLKLKVIEADQLVNEVLKAKGFKGPTLADRLKQANFEGLPGVELAWQAHKLRNRLVHEGGQLEQTELRQALKNYEQTLKAWKLL